MRRVLLLSLVLAVTGNVLAQDAWWYGSSGNGKWSWNTNWAGGTIGGTGTDDDVKFWPDAGKGSVTLDYSTEISYLTMSLSDAAETSSQLVVDDAVLTVNGGGGTWVGNISGMSASIQITNGGSVVHPNGPIDIGFDGDGELVMDSGTLTCGNWLRMTDNSAGSSHISMTGGVIESWAFWMTGDGVDDNLLMELYGGEVILTGRGDVTGEITNWMNLGWITGNEVSAYYDPNTACTYITSASLVPETPEDRWWYGGSGDGMWSISANWAGGTVGGTYSNDDVKFWPDAGKGLVTLDYSTEISYLTMSLSGAAETSSQLVVDDAVLTVNGGGGTWVGNISGMSASIQITNGGSVVHPNGPIDIGYDGNGELVMDSGTLTCGNWLRMTDNSAGFSHISMTGGVIESWAFWMTGDGVDDNLLMELYGGEVILTGRGDVTGEITNWMNLGWITGNEVTTYYDAQTGYTHITSVSTPPGDFNGDNVIDVQDLSVMVSDWLKTGISGYDDYFPRGFQAGVIPSFQVPRAVTPPVIDGMFYANEWDGAMAVEVLYPDIDIAPKDAEIWMGAWPATPAEFSATWYFKWDPNNFYIAVSVYDDSPSSLDKLQLGFDFGATAPDYLWDNSAIYDLTVGAGGTADMSRLHNDTYIGNFTTQEEAAICYKGSVFSGGYLYEAAIPWWVMDFLNMPGTYVPAIGDHHGIALLHLNYNDSDLTTAMSAFSPLPWGPADGSFASMTITLVENSAQDSALPWNTGPTHYYPLQSVADLYQEPQPDDIVNFKDFVVFAENWFFGH